jgi:hypothetical protein
MLLRFVEQQNIPLGHRRTSDLKNELSTNIAAFNELTILIQKPNYMVARGSVVVMALRFKPECLWFETR